MDQPDKQQPLLDNCPVCGSIGRTELKNPSNPWYQLVGENKRLKAELELMDIAKGRRRKWPT